MRIKRCLAATALLATSIAFESRALAAPSVELSVDPASTCGQTSAMATMLAARGITTTGAADAKVRVRAITTADGAEASFVIESGGRTATRTLTAPTCEEVLEAASYALSLALELPEPGPTPPAPVPTAAPAPTATQTPTTPRPPLRWGGEAAFGIFAGATPDVAPVLAARADLESTSEGVLAPSASVGAAFVFPSSTTSAGADVSFALQTGLVDGCPVRLGRRFSLRPCVELQVGRLQSRGAGVPGARLESSAWAALGLTLRGRAEIGAGISAELALTGGSPLIQDAFAIGNSGVFDTGPLLFSATFGVGVHFP